MNHSLNKRAQRIAGTLVGLWLFLVVLKLNGGFA